MQRRIVISKGKKYLVNAPSGDCDGVGPGFPAGSMVFKSATDSFWYVVTASGSLNDVSASVSQSALSFPATSYFDQNFPYQLLLASDGNPYQVYLSGSAPDATLLVSQSVYTSTGSLAPKPYLILQNITDSNFYRFYLLSGSSGITMNVDQTVISSSWLHF